MSKLKDTSREFVEGLNQMQRILNVPTKSDDNLTVLQAVSKLISEKLNPKIVQSFLEQHQSSKEVTFYFFLLVLIKECTKPIQLTLNSINGGIDCKGN